MASVARGFVKFLVIFIVVIILAVWFLPAPLIKWGIEKFGTQAVGAKVEVENVDFSWLSARLALENLAVTNPQKPMTNLVAFNNIATEVNIGELIAGKVYLNEVAIEGIMLDSPRTHSGAIPGLQNDPVFAEEDSGFAIPGVDLPDTQTLVAEEKAVYEKRIQELEADIAAKQQQWQAIKDDLPDQARLDEYKERFEKLRKELKKEKNPLSRLATVQKINDLAKEMKQEMKSFDKAKDQVKQEYQALRKQLATLKSLPDQSFAEIVKTLGLEESRLANLGANLMEGPMRVWLEKGYNYYRLMSGGSTEPASTTTEAQAPKTDPTVFIELTKLSGVFTQGGKKGSIEGTIKNLCDAPGLSGKPILLDINALGERMGKISLQGEIDHVTPGKEKDEIIFKMVESALADFSISDSEALNVLLKKALVNLDAKASITSLQSLSLDFDSVFKSLEVAAGGKGELSSTQQAVIEALQGLTELIVDGSASGSVKDPKLSLSSNLDDVLKKALGDVIAEKTQAFKAELTSKLNAQLKEQMAPLENKLQNAAGISTQIDQLDEEFKQLLDKVKV